MRHTTEGGPIHEGHFDIRDHHGNFVAPTGVDRQRLGAILSGDHLITAILHSPFNGFSYKHLVVSDEHELALTTLRILVGDFLLFLHGRRRIRRKENAQSRAATLLALDHHEAPVPLHSRLSIGESEAESLLRCLRRVKRLCHMRATLGIDSDPGIREDKTHVGNRLSARIAMHVLAHLNKILISVPIDLAEL